MRTRLTVTVVLVCVFALIAAACNPQVGTPSTQPHLNQTVLLSGLDHPWDLAFTPDGHMLVTERTGTLSWVAGGVKHVLYQPKDVQLGSEGGMLGIAVDPAFGFDRTVYICMDSNVSGHADVRVFRVMIEPDWSGVIPGSRVDIVTGIPYSSGRHSGCRPRFGPDGYLYVGTGDSAQNDVSQNLNSLGGKVLKVDRNGNPEPGFSRIFSYGHRNVQGIAFEPFTGRVFNIEHGTQVDDEINVNVRGGNYGWQPGPGYDESWPMTNHTLYPFAISALWSSGNPTVAPSGGTFVVGKQWKVWNGALAVAVLKDEELLWFAITPGGGLRGAPVVTMQYGYRLRTAVEGPDGNLYLTTDDTGSRGQIWKITPS
jgi:glucose/arabinose dehydrogenase